MSQPLIWKNNNPEYLMKMELDITKKEDVPAMVEKMRALAAEEIKKH